MGPLVRVLIVEDDSDLAATIGDYLGERGCIVHTASDGVTGLHTASINEFDVIVLDLMLPAMGGINVCRKLRREAHLSTPILMLSARDTLDERLQGFQCGADDYVVKPVALAELQARVLAIARRSKRPENTVLRVADLSYNIGTLVVSRGDATIPLDATELKLLRVLMEASPSIVTKHDLNWQVWGHDTPGSQALCTTIHRLRSVIDKPHQTSLIRTHQGVGYRIVELDADTEQVQVEAAPRLRPRSQSLMRASHRA